MSSLKFGWMSSAYSVQEPYRQSQLKKYLVHHVKFPGSRQTTSSPKYTTTTYLCWSNKKYSQFVDDLILLPAGQLVVESSCSWSRRPTLLEGGGSSLSPPPLHTQLGSLGTFYLVPPPPSSPPPSASITTQGRMGRGGGSRPITQCFSCSLLPKYICCLFVQILLKIFSPHQVKRGKSGHFQRNILCSWK